MPKEMAYRPGDKVGFSGYGHGSAAIQIGTYGLPNLGGWWPSAMSSLSHVGVIGRWTNGELYLFESTDEEDCPLKCAIQGKVANGVQAHRIDERIQSYCGKVWHYPLVTPFYAHEIERSTEYLKQYIGVGYDLEGAYKCGFANWTYGLRWLSAFIDEENLQWMFCSEFVAGHDSTVGVFKTDNASLWTPNYLIRCQRRASLVHRPFRKK